MGQKVALLTGFGPFGSYAVNPTERLVRAMHGLILGGGYIICGEVLPPSYERAPLRVIELARELQPAAILSLGFASRIPRIRVETRGYNKKNSDYEDADGACHKGDPIVPGGAEFFYTNAPNEALVEMIIASGVDIELSSDPERFICNCLIFSIAREIYESHLDTIFGYIHTPTTESCSHLVARHPEKVIIPDEHLAGAVLIALATMCQVREACA